ncbi:alpha/beta fold hydrolase [Chitinophaga rhizophila]|uniref:Alpha/beta hydrolase n=1 Tax=Chitinophaga rhizophila TaxID=2866212 RepID=A0ABS7GA28_9BACT|nr:alpha/beta hydrolase [Chitinophaga rhizophila]MBW8684499.1 alpha/beta hydrolase [Chitinophaga rhizophila]
MTRFTPCSLMLLFLLACGNNNNQTASRTQHNDTVSITSQGAHINYEDSKSGDTTLLFVHGWCINNTYWSAQKEHFAPRYRVVTIDLPGFGKSGKQRDTWSVENYGKDIHTMISRLGLKNVILVGHSMSGAIVLETALEHPEDVIAIVGVDNFKDADYEETDALRKENDAFYQSARENFRESMGPAVINQWLFAKNTDTAIMHRVTIDILTADTTIAVDCLELNDRYPLARKLPQYSHTLYLINSSGFPTDTAAFTKLKIRYKLYEVGPTGHYPMLESTDKFNSALESVLADIGQGK